MLRMMEGRAGETVMHDRNERPLRMDMVGAVAYKFETVVRNYLNELENRSVL
jgi:hypothetical protein